MKREIVDDLGFLWLNDINVRAVMIYKGKSDAGADCAIVEVSTENHKYNLQYTNHEKGMAVALELKELLI